MHSAMANPEVGGVKRTIDDGNAVVNSGSVSNKHDQDPASDTEQYVGVDVTNQRPGSKKKACFQITSVSKRNAAEHDANIDDPDSNDELDESRAEEFSSSELIDSFNVSKNSIADLDRLVDETGAGNGVISLIPASGSDEQTNIGVAASASQANGNGPHRFKVVKVATTEPIRKGRWTCRDFPSESAKSQTTPEGLRNQDSSKDTLVHSGNSSAASSVHYIYGQDNSDNPLAQVDESGKPSDLSRKASRTSSKDVGNHNNASAHYDQKDDRLGLEQLKGELQEHTSDSTEGDDGTSPAGGAIDNKIEQAMDLVKSHLLFAVREEVEVLKEQIKILVEKNEVLQEENATLKQRLQGANAPPPGGPTPGIGLTTAQQPTHPQQHIPNPEQPQYPNRANQMGQTPMGQTMSDHAAYPQHPRPTQQTHSTPNPGGIADTKPPQYTPQTSVESQGQYHSAHSQLHLPPTGQAPQQQAQQHLPPQGLQDMSQYSQVGGNVAATAPSQATPQAAPQTQSYHASMAPGAASSRHNSTH